MIAGLWARTDVWGLSSSDSSLVATVSSDSFCFASRDVLPSLDVKKNSPIIGSINCLGTEREEF